MSPCIHDVSLLVPCPMCKEPYRGVEIKKLQAELEQKDAQIAQQQAQIKELVEVLESVRNYRNKWTDSLDQKRSNEEKIDFLLDHISAKHKEKNGTSR